MGYELVVCLPPAHPDPLPAGHKTRDGTKTENDTFCNSPPPPRAPKVPGLGKQNFVYFYFYLFELKFKKARYNGWLEISTLGLVIVCVAHLRGLTHLESKTLGAVWRFLRGTLGLGFGGEAIVRSVKHKETGPGMRRKEKKCSIGSSPPPP